MKKFNGILCSNCSSYLKFKSNELICCSECESQYKVIGNVVNMNIDSYHDNFGYQWNIHSKTQLDSHNGSNESESRLLNQSKLTRKDFVGKRILEIGSGNGRFTEILLKYGAKVVSCDYSSAIYANYDNNNCSSAIFLRANLFNINIEPDYFDMVICYGVIQHTGNNQNAIEKLYSLPIKKKGLLLMDIYSNSIRHFNPFIYVIRFFVSFHSGTIEDKYNLITRFINLVFPSQLWLLKQTRKWSLLGRIIELVINRSPNSVYGINLYLDQKISIDIAKSWSILDTFDAWFPKHDNPVSFKTWNKLNFLFSKKYNFSVNYIGTSGQGNIVVSSKN